MAVLDATQVEGTTAKAVKQLLAAHVGATRFRQRLFREGDFGEIPDDEVFTSLPTKLQLVVCEFCPPDAEKERQMIFAITNNDLMALEELLKRPQMSLPKMKAVKRHCTVRQHAVIWKPCSFCLRQEQIEMHATCSGQQLYILQL